MLKKDVVKGYLAAFLNACIIGLAFLFTKKAVNITNPYNTLAIRFMVSFLGGIILILFKIVKLELKKKHMKKLVLISLLFPSGFFLVQSFGLKYASSSEAGIIYALTPVIVMIMSYIFLKEKVNAYQCIAILFSVAGVVYIFMMKGSKINPQNILGIFLIFLSSVFFGLYSILSRKYSKEFKPIDICFFMQGFGFFIFTFLSIVKGFDFKEFKGLVSNFEFMSAILYLAIPSTLITAFLNNYSLSKLEASKVGVFSNISTIVSIVAGGVFLKEEIRYFHVIGSCVIIFGILGTNYFGKKSYFPQDKMKENRVNEASAVNK